MTMSLQEISDRVEIHDLLVSYSHAIDSRNWDALDDVFTDDAFIDSTTMHGFMGDLQSTKRFLEVASPTFAGGYHMVATSKIMLEGDVAQGRTICHNAVVSDVGDGRTHVMFCGLWYRDRFVRTSDGWRINERVTERCYYHNVPPELAFLQGHHDAHCACTQGLLGDRSAEIQP
jgi:hypothetical protein